jgi:hypothetical protein
VGLCVSGKRFVFSFEFEFLKCWAWVLSGKQNSWAPFIDIGVRRMISFLTLAEAAYDEKRILSMCRTRNVSESVKKKSSAFLIKSTEGLTSFEIKQIQKDAEIVLDGQLKRGCVTSV